jgi:DNA-binding MarR family transcriptional regulator
MKRLTINHLRAIKNFSKSNTNNKISDYEKFLNQFVSIPTARKIIKELIEFKLVKVISSRNDLRVKFLVITEMDLEKLI